MHENGIIGVADFTEPTYKGTLSGQAFSDGTTLRGAKWTDEINTVVHARILNANPWGELNSNFESLQRNFCVPEVG